MVAHNGYVSSMAFGRGVLATGGSDGAVVLWDVADDPLRLDALGTLARLTRDAGHVAYAPRGDLVATGRTTAPSPCGTSALPPGSDRNRATGPPVRDAAP